MEINLRRFFRGAKGKAKHSEAANGPAQPIQLAVSENVRGVPTE